MVSFEELLTLLKPYKGLEGPAKQAICLWKDGGCGIWISDSWGPAVPYPEVDHGDGNFNHGYRRMKGNLEAAMLIPEAQGWPELQTFLENVNADSSPIETVGCEKGFFPGEQETLPIMLGSYVDVIFTDIPLNENPQNFLLLSSRLVPAVEHCERWWANISFALQRNRALAGAEKPWGLMLNIQNYGRNEAEARKFWGESLSRLGSAIKVLNADFPTDQEK